MVAVASINTTIRIGDRIDGRYRVIDLIADGGMGTVFLCEHVLIKRRVAVKVLHRDLAHDVLMVQRFLNEASAAGTLGHPNIVESTDMGFTPDQVPFIVFEYLDGHLLTKEVYRVGGLPDRRALRLAGRHTRARAPRRSRRRWREAARATPARVARRDSGPRARSGRHAARDRDRGGRADAAPARCDDRRDPGVAQRDRDGCGDAAGSDRERARARRPARRTRRPG